MATGKDPASDSRLGGASALNDHEFQRLLGTTLIQATRKGVVTEVAAFVVTLFEGDEKVMGVIANLYKLLGDLTPDDRKRAFTALDALLNLQRKLESGR